MRRGRTIGVVALAAVAAVAIGLPAASAHRAPASKGADGARTPASSFNCHGAPTEPTTCYVASQLQAAYDLAPLYAKGIEGQHETIVLVDAFGSPTISSDLQTFDAGMGLPAPPSFKVITPRGPIKPFSQRGKHALGWAEETSLDVEWAHALAPKASILLVETPTDEVEGTSGFADIVAAENYVIAHKLGTVISQSFGATEETFASKAQLSHYRSAFLAAQKAGVSVLASSGDLGATDYESNAATIYPHRVTSWPASDPLVTAVGGTRLTLTKAGSQSAPATVWNDTFAGAPPSPSASGGGRSEFFARPSYQGAVKATTGTHRGVPDVSMNAACSSQVDVYVAPVPGAGWVGMCGTSEASPLFAAIVALADQEAGHGLGLLNPALYALLSVPNSGLVPVTSGNNTVAFRSGAKTVTVTGFAARAGYNLVTGVGTIDAARFVPALVHEWNVLHKK